MKNFILILLVSLASSYVAQAQRLQPYTIGAETTGSIAEVKSQVKASLKNAGFQISGEYKPAGDANRWLFVLTSQELKNAVAKVGGLTGFAAALRVAVTNEGGKIIISYTTPEYWGNAYFR